MLDELNRSLETYDQKWQRLVAERSNKEFFAGLKPITAGWKTEDKAEYDRILAALLDQTDLVAQTWMNGRWIATLHLKDRVLTSGIEVIEVIQRRPGSSDTTGLDFVDFYSLTGLHKNEEVLTAEPALQWSRESNSAMKDGYDWHSIWFDGTEAKIKYYTVIDIVRVGLGGLDEKLTASLRSSSNVN